MKTLARVTILGVVGKEPEVRYTANGTAVATYSVATEENVKGQKVTHWHNCVCFDKLANLIEQYVHKGSKLYLEGKLQYQSYDKDGEKRLATKIIVNEVSFLSSSGESSDGEPSQPTPSKFQPPAKAVVELEDSECPF